MEANIEAALAAEAVGADRVKTALTTLVCGVLSICGFCG
jgi:hypothetical protein